MSTLARVLIVAVVVAGGAGGVLYLDRPDYEVGEGSASVTVRESPSNATLTQAADDYRSTFPTCR